MANSLISSLAPYLETAKLSASRIGQIVEGLASLAEVARAMRRDGSAPIIVR
jgi:hypothetical protein